MQQTAWTQRPQKPNYDVVIIGGAIYGSSLAWFLSSNTDFDGSILVIERDPSYEKSATALTNSCIRQQFSNPLNIQISQFGARYINSFREQMGGDERVPDLAIQSYGYLYLADSEDFASNLRAAQQIQAGLGAATRLLDARQIQKEYPFYRVDDIILGSINTVNEGYWDGGTVFDWWRRRARENGVEYLAGEAVDIRLNSSGSRVEAVTLASGDTVACGYVVNATGARGAQTAKMAGIEIPVEPRKRFTWIFAAETPLQQELPLTIDPSGVHVRQDGPATYLAGGHAEEDGAADCDDFSMDHALWNEKIWPAIANRIPQFEAIKVIAEWAGHYDYNVFDQNAIVGPHPEIENFLFLNGFSGHGLQQSPAIGKGLAEWIIYGAYRGLDLAPFGYERLKSGRKFGESAII